MIKYFKRIEQKHYQEAYDRGYMWAKREIEKGMTEDYINSYLRNEPFDHGAAEFLREYESAETKEKPSAEVTKIVAVPTLNLFRQQIWNLIHDLDDGTPLASVIGVLDIVKFELCQKMYEDE